MRVHVVSTIIAGGALVGGRASKRRVGIPGVVGNVIVAMILHVIKSNNKVDLYK